MALDEACFPSRWAYPYSLVSFTVHWLPDWGRRLTQTFFKFTIPWRARVEGPAGVVNQCGLAHFRVRLSTVTRLISAPCKSSSGRRKTYLVVRYCLLHVPNNSMILARHGEGVPAG